MTGKIKYLQHLNGRFYTRIVVPPHLRQYLDEKSELRAPLGSDRRIAMRKHTIAVAELMHRITLAERRAAQDKGNPEPPNRYPLTNAQIALSSYNARMMQDWDARTTGSGYARVGIDDGYAAMLRAGIAGATSDAELDELVGHRIGHFRKIGNTTAERGTPEWRSLAMALCVSEYEALERLVERDEGNFTGIPAHPLIRDAEPIEDESPPVSLRGLFRDYIAAKRAVGKGREAERRWGKVFENLCKFVRHDDARKLTKADFKDWRDSLMSDKSPKTVESVYLAAVRTVLNWAVREDRLSENPAANVRQEQAKKIHTRSKGFTDEEATRILLASAAYTPAPFVDGPPREFPETTAAKRWVPILCAFTGARVVEVTQLRKQDIRRDGDHYVVRITPDAGTVKTGQYRDVPLHFQVIERGFMDFVKAAADGPLFYRAKDGQQDLQAARTVANRVAGWIGKYGLVPEGVRPNHGWRHRFRTQAREINVSDRIADAICGHAGRTAGDEYGDVTIAAKARLIDQMPRYCLEGLSSKSDDSPIG